MIIFIINILL